MVSYAQITLRISLLETPLEPDDKSLFFYLGVVSRLVMKDGYKPVGLPTIFLT